MAERQALRDAIGVGRVHRGRAAEGTAALRPLGLSQVALAGVCVQDFSARRNLEPFGHGFLGLNAFWTSHKISFLSKERAIYEAIRAGASDYFQP
jgi:hypothetical protein